jgi:hypothetical protein
VRRGGGSPKNLPLTERGGDLLNSQTPGVVMPLFSFLR